MRHSSAPHDGSVPATYVLDESAQTIELIGRGAYIGLPKAVNGAELKSPANAESVKYQIDVLEEDQLVIYVQAGGNVHWTFRLRPWVSEQAQTVDVFEDWTVPCLKVPNLNRV